MLCSSPPIERARPLLGTIVAVRVYGLEAAAAHRAIGEAFEAIAKIHARMSFHDAASDVGRLNRDAAETPVHVHAETYAVLAEALRLSEASDGCFDISIGAALVAKGLLPRPDARHTPDPRASWRDIALCADGHVQFHRPLWIDLGGIAKGYAVDRAVQALREAGVERACVNAGGDLRVLGAVAEPIHLRTGARERHMPVVTVADGSLASSGSLDGAFASPHIGAAMGRFVAVAAARCLIADALTKIVLAQGRSCEPLLRRYGARAFLLETGLDWTALGAAA